MFLTETNVKSYIYKKGGFSLNFYAKTLFLILSLFKYISQYKLIL